MVVCHGIPHWFGLEVCSFAYRYEVHCFLISGIVKGIAVGVVYSLAPLLPVVILISYHVTGHNITTEKVFTTIMYGSMLESVGVWGVIHFVQHVGQVMKSLVRIQVGQQLPICHRGQTFPLPLLLWSVLEYVFSFHKGILTVYLQSPQQLCTTPRLTHVQKTSPRPFD